MRRGPELCNLGQVLVRAGGVAKTLSVCRIQDSQRLVPHFPGGAPEKKGLQTEPPGVKNSGIISVSRASDPARELLNMSDPMARMGHD